MHTYCLVFVMFSLLQEMASGLKDEIAERLLKLNVSTFTMMPVKVGNFLDLPIFYR